MRITSLISAALAAAGNTPNLLQQAMLTPRAFRGATPSRRVRAKADHVYEGCPQSNKNDALPRGYPGAKLARKAAMAYACVNHPRGLRANGATI